MFSQSTVEDLNFRSNIHQTQLWTLIRNDSFVWLLSFKKHVTNLLESGLNVEKLGYYVEACLYPLCLFFQGYKVRGFLPRHQNKCCFPIGIF